jgi:hypothetical protein
MCLWRWRGGVAARGPAVKRRPMATATGLPRPCRCPRGGLPIEGGHLRSFPCLRGTPEPRGPEGAHPGREEDSHVRPPMQTASIIVAPTARDRPRDTPSSAPASASGRVNWSSSTLYVLARDPRRQSIPNTQPLRVLRPGFHRAAAAASPPQRRRQRHGADHAVHADVGCEALHRSRRTATSRTSGSRSWMRRGTIRSLSAASARDPSAATGAPAGYSVHAVPHSRPPARRRTSSPGSRPSRGRRRRRAEERRSLRGGS